mmetsp:Transcript_24391/g.67800  ORF Transcript_24391/g.67800 Transcript_24391/m.67800 type:complete len:568 (+) Transcript_24391:411-2114(+)
MPELEGSAAAEIKVPPLRVRPADIPVMVQYFLRQESRGLAAPVSITPEALRKLQAYKFPQNIVELQAAVKRAVKHESDESREPAVTEKKLTTDVFWFASEEDTRYRLDLMTAFPALRKLLRSQLFPRELNFNVVAPVYAAVVLLLFLGPQDRAHNFALNVFWCWWWPGIFIVYPFLGRVWCSICPFMIYGEIAQKLRVEAGAKLMKWPRESVEAWGPWFLYLLFFAILVWEECWHLNDNASLSAWLLLLITAGAVVCSALFERRLWCRYLCPIGGMNGLFAKLSMTEIRSRQGVCSGSCSTYHCYKGGPAQPPGGLESPGCPLYSHPAQLADNRHCVLCMECVKACPHGSVEFNFRPPGADLWQGHKSDVSEVALMFLLLGAVYLHCLPDICAALGIDPDSITASLGVHIAVSAGVLAVPGLLIWLSDAALHLGLRLRGPSRVSRASEEWVTVAYGWLPVVWAVTLAFYTDSLMGEAGKVLPVMAATFGADGSWLPQVVVQSPVIAFVQALLLAGGAGISGIMTWHLDRDRATPRVMLQWLLIAISTNQLWGFIIHESWILPLVPSY